ncbi:MFS transporter [Pelagicoccus sp. SDUM812002]|uniref:MFS transporter n=1 Tax=Pelagicoccus sp. SDUM812002 TaxID=3041266 RepID=UPI00281093EA|nr:MFS transporter [Pelagicoccus sp. SDUM812002]MDQ8184820.1 MFS transporter [Pelagicoccus sp. SDUM812002]
MRSLNTQFFLLFGSFAAVQPYIALLFKDRGLGEQQIGYAIGISGWAIILSPAVVTLIADTRVSPSRLLSGLSVATAIATVAMLMSTSYWMMAAFYFIMTLCMTSMMPLLDGVTFGIQRVQRERGETPLEYSRVRVWGTCGYVGILALLFFPIRMTGDVSLLIWAGVLCYCILMVNTWFLPQRGKRELAKRSKGLPTGEAVKALFGRRSALFSISMFLLLCASAAYHTMYPVFLVDDLGLARHWLGIVILSGALIEVFCILALSNLERRWGLRSVMLGCVALTVLRFGLMYAFPVLWVAIGAQLFHGAMICAMMVIPPNFVNGLASDSNRNSIQGVYTMMVIGSSRFLGTALAGHVAGVDQRLIYALCGGLAVLAFALLWKGFRPEEDEVAI